MRRYPERVEGWFFATAALLVVSGVSKLVDPIPTAGALHTARLPSAHSLVRWFGLTEVGVGLGNLLWANVALAATQAAVYLAFALFVAWAMSQNLPISSCGCFGKADTPPSWVHVAINGLAAVGGATHALLGASSLLAILSSQPMGGVPYLGFVGLGTYCLYLLLGELPILRTNT
jgi:hypothetical protein